MGVSNDLTLKFILDYMPGHIYWKDADGVYLGCNDRQAKSLGLSKGSEVVGKTDNQLPWPDKLMAESFRRNDLNVIESRERLLVEEKSFIDGKKVVVLSEKIPLEENGEVVGVLGISIDITQLKETQRKLEVASQVKSEFIKNISHDLRTPITGILGLAQSFKTGAKNSRQAEDAGLLIDTTNEILHFLNEVIEVVRLDNSLFDIKDEIFSVYEVVEHNRLLLQSATKDKGIDFEVKFDEKLPAAVTGRRLYLDRILLNLLSNAVKFTEKGSVKLLIDLVSRTVDRVVIRFRIEDSGIGIPAEKLPTIFNCFTRLTPSYRGIYSGNGIGLYTVKKYVEAMEGSIDVRSDEGAGSVFTVELPFGMADESKLSLLEDTKEVEKTPKTLENESGDFLVDDPIATILVVEDHFLAARMAAQLLQEHECASDIASNGEQALQMARNKTYDLILMDIGLPDISGVEVAKFLRKDIDAKTTPIIALTGHVNSDGIKDCIDAGMQAVIPKPLDISGLKKALGTYVFPPEDDEDHETFFNVAESPVAQDYLSSITIDIEEGTRLAGGNLASAREMIKLLVETLPSDIEEIKQAADANNTRRLYDIVHRVYGGLCYCGVPCLRGLFNQFKQALLAEEFDDIKHHVQKISQEADKLISEAGRL